MPKSERVLILRGELSEREEELSHIDSKIENEVNAVICALPLFDLDEIEARIDNAGVAFDALKKCVSRRVELKTEISKIRAELGQ